jgi:hypothetical protein
VIRVSEVNAVKPKPKGNQMIKRNTKTKTAKKTTTPKAKRNVKRTVKARARKAA